MSRRFASFLSAAGLALMVALPALAQRGGRPAVYESPEPPLADAVQPTGAREPRPLAPSVRLTDSPVPVVQLFVRAPTVLPVGQDADVRLVVENSSRVPARNVVVVYAPPPAAGVVK